MMMMIPRICSKQQTTLLMYIIVKCVWALFYSSISNQTLTSYLLLVALLVGRAVGCFVCWTTLLVCVLFVKHLWHLHTKHVVFSFLQQNTPNNFKT